MFGRSDARYDTRPRRIAPDDVPEGLDRAAFAAGCFWGVEEFFLAVPGVVDAVSGLRGRLRRPPDLRAGLLGHDRPCRGGAGDLRPGPGHLRDPPRGVLAPPRPDHPRPPGPRPRAPSTARPSSSATRPRTQAARASLEQVPGPLQAPHRHRGDPASTFWPAEAYHQRYTERTGRGGCHVANW